jgi:hypothetical protein
LFLKEQIGLLDSLKNVLNNAKNKLCGVNLMTFYHSANDWRVILVLFNF